MARPGPDGRTATQTWRCGVCGADAGAIALGDDGALRRETFTGVLTEEVRDAGRLAALRDAIAAGDGAALFAADPELAPWWCPDCRCAYCGAHWARTDVFDPDEPAFHEGIRGRCPQGHERLFED